jgi:ABC-2 type transport system permease protein
MRESGWGVSGWSAAPARALFGQALPLLGTALFALLLFALTSLLFSRHFLASYQSAGDRGSRPVRSSHSVRTRFSRSLAGTILLKELRLLTREPGMLFMMLLRLIYLMPILVAGLSKGGGAKTLATLGAVGVIAAGQLCGSLAWVTISAEDAPDLLGVAPVAARRLKGLKLAAALIMGLPIALIMPALLAARSPVAALIALIGSAAAGGGAGLVELLFGKPGKRSTFANRRQRSLLTSLVGIFASLVVGGLTALAIVFATR